MNNLLALLRFGTVGGSGFVIDGGLLMLLSQLGLGLHLGRLLSLTASIIVTFFMNRTFTFGARHPPTWLEFSLYIKAALVGSVLNYMLYSAGLFMGFHPLLALAIATSVTAVFNFFQFKKLFSRHSAERHSKDMTDQKTPRGEG